MSTDATERHRRDFVAAAAGAVVGLDFDGTLSPIVADPEQAFIHPAAPEALRALGAHVRAVVVITGRPVEVVLRLGDLEALGAQLRESDTGLLVFGQYGNERWAADTGDVVSPEPPAGLVDFTNALPELLAQADAPDAYVEDKGLAIGIHTRRLADPRAAFERLLPIVSEVAQRHDLAVEPGRNVIEVRAGGMTKGDVVDTVISELAPTGFLFAGDDLGDVAAFEALARHRSDGLPVLLVCAGSTEEQALADRADILVDGPDGVVDTLLGLAAEIG